MSVVFQVAANPGRPREANTSTILFVALCAAGEGFLIYCLFQFVRESKASGKAHRQERVNRSAVERSIVPVQMVGPVATAMWSEGTWQSYIYGDSPAPKVRSTTSGR